MTDRPPRRRQSLATRIALLSVGIAVVTALVAGALAIGLIRNSGAGTARSELSKLADVATSATPVRKSQLKLRGALNALNIRYAIVRVDGTLAPDAPALVQKAITQKDITTVLAGGKVHAQRVVGGSTTFVEGRSNRRAVPGEQGTKPFGIFLVQKRADAVARNQAAIRRLLLALLIAGTFAAIVGLLVAWRLARPLRRTAAAAHSLAAGNRDVTLPAQGPHEVVEVSDAINTLAAALRHSEGRQREFLLSVSHDLRTPLTALSGYAESLADDVIPTEQTAYVGGVMLGEAKRLERLVGDLLDLARLGARDFRIDLASVDLVGLVYSAAGVWDARCRASGPRFVLEAPDEPVWAHTDAARVRQVLDGLFDNALRVTPAGAPIVLAARSEPGWGVVEVRDGGPGLADDDLAIAFEQGALYDRYRGIRQVGTGLGLAIVHGLVTRLGGRVEAGHAHEGGARFTVRLPLLPPGATSSP